jgi:hypothetical protein
MCAHNDPATLRKLRRRTKSIRAWKVLRKSGSNFYHWVAQADYGPGRVKAVKADRTTRYNSDRPRGLHAYRTKRTARGLSGYLCAVVPVYIDPADLIAAEPACKGTAQLVACRLTIRPEDWEAAKLPKRVTRRRYV